MIDSTLYGRLSVKFDFELGTMPAQVLLTILLLIVLVPVTEDMLLKHIAEVGALARCQHLGSWPPWHQVGQPPFSSHTLFTFLSLEMVTEALCRGAKILGSRHQSMWSALASLGGGGSPWFRQKNPLDWEHVLLRSRPDHGLNSL